MKLKKTLISASVGVVALAGVVGLVPDTMSNAEIAAVELHAQEIFGGNAEAVKQMIFDEMKPAKVKLKGKNWELTGENFKSTLKENAVDGWEYEENGKTLGFKSKGMAWDGAKVKTKAAKVKGKIRKNEVDYEDALGAGVDIKIVQGNNKFQKIIEIESLASLGEIPEGAEFLEFSFKLSGDFDLPEGRITDRVPFGDNSFVNPVRAWDSSDGEIESGAFGEITGKTLTKKIPVAWLQQATFPVKTDATITFGSAAVFDETITAYISVTFDSGSGKVVVAYSDSSNSSYGMAAVGTVSGTGISWGTPAAFNEGSSAHISIAYDENAQKVVVAYTSGGDSNYGYAAVGTVSGTGISFGTPVEFNAGTTAYISSAYDANTQKVVIAYQDAGNNNFGTAIVGTVALTAISFGAENVFESAYTLSTSIAYDSNAQKVVVSYRDYGNNSYGTSAVGTVSGTGISFGTPEVFETSAIEDTATVYDSVNKKIVVAYKDTGDLSKGKAAVGTVSGTGISFGTPVEFNAGTTAYISATFDANAGRVAVSYKDDGGDDYGEAVAGTISGTGISFTAPDIFESAVTNYISTTYDSTNKKIVIAYNDGGNSSYGTGIVGTVAAAAAGNTGSFFQFFD